MTKVPSFTFAGGELSRGLWGRVDLQKYQTGVKLAKNMVVAVEGGLRKRVGHYFIGKRKFQDKASKLVSWRIAPNDSYMLEFGDLFIRFIRLGGYVAIPGGHIHHADNDAANVSGFMEIVTPYTAAQVRELKFTFANDIMYIYHNAHQPRKLTRLGLYDWAFDLMDFDPQVDGPENLTATWEKYTASTKTWDEIADAEDDDFGFYVATRKAINYIVTALMPDGLESKVSNIATDVGDLGHQRFRMHLEWDAVTDAVEYSIYKGENGVYGFIGRVAGVGSSPPDTTFDDTNFAPSYEQVPPGSFGGFNPEDATDWPRVGEFYKQRMAFAATRANTQGMWFSRPLFFDALYNSTPAQEDDAVEFTLVGNKRHTINHLVQLKKFVIFTDSGEWLLETVGDSAFSAATADPILETTYGADPNLDPLPIGDRILFVQGISGTIYDMGYEFTNDAYQADDLSRLARDLFKATDVIAWTYANFPNNIIPCVTTSRILPVMTYSREHEIWGWARWTTQGRYLDVASVDEGDQDALYFQTSRIINGVETFFIERSEEVFSNRIEELFYVDCGLSYYNSKRFDNLVRLSENFIEVDCAGHGLTVDDVVLIEDDPIYLEDSDTPLTYLRIKFTVTAVDGDTLTLETLYTDTTVPEDLGSLEGDLFICETAFSGFEHLANQDGLVALGDGKVFSNIAVDASGEFTLPEPVARMHAGFPYEGRVQTLDLDFTRLAGQYNNRSVRRVQIHLENSRGIFVGASEATSRELTELPPRDTQDDYSSPNPVLDGVYDIPAHISTGPTAGVIVSAPYPLPCNVLNIVPDLTYEDAD